MDRLIKALNIFLLYGNPEYPTHCEHDTLYIVGIDPDEVSEEHKQELEQLGFIIDDDNCFISYEFGSA